LYKRFLGFDVGGDTGALKETCRRVELEDDSEVAADTTLIAGDADLGCVELDAERECVA
jgi:hypothetical protein